MDIVIVNTGCANITSVRYAIERLGYKVALSDLPERIGQADRVILPGVGNANAALKALGDKGLIGVLPQLTQPVLGICLGMQLLGTEMDEGKDSLGNVPRGLGVIPTPIEALKNNGVRLPHMGWNTIQIATNSSLFDGLDGAYFYFVHSFAAPVGEHSLAVCDYGQHFSAAIGHNNFYGVQFHPERSGPAGARLLTNFIQRGDSSRC